MKSKIITTSEIARNIKELQFTYQPVDIVNGITDMMNNYYVAYSMKFIIHKLLGYDNFQSLKINRIETLKKKDEYSIYFTIGNYNG